MVYLGIEIDSVEQTISIPEGKYTEIMDLLPQWVNKRTCTKQQLLSLIRKLSFVSKVVRPGRIFLQRFINLSMTVRELHQHVTLTKSIQEDIKWWLDFLPGWNQESIIPESDELFSHDIHLFTDASNIGFGAIYYYAWIQSGWNEIDFKELYICYCCCCSNMESSLGREEDCVCDRQFTNHTSMGYGLNKITGVNAISKEIVFDYSQRVFFLFHLNIYLVYIILLLMLFHVSRLLAFVN